MVVPENPYLVVQIALRLDQYRKKVENWAEACRKATEKQPSNRMPHLGYDMRLLYLEMGRQGYPLEAWSEAIPDGIRLGRAFAEYDQDKIMALINELGLLRVRDLENILLILRARHHIFARHGAPRKKA